jgi:hypothetical protein
MQDAKPVEPKTTLEAPTGHTINTDEIRTGKWKVRHVQFDRIPENPNSYFVVRRQLSDGTFTQNYCAGGDEAEKFQNMNAARQLAGNLNAMEEMK